MKSQINTRLKIGDVSINPYRPDIYSIVIGIKSNEVLLVVFDEEHIYPYKTFVARSADDLDYWWGINTKVGDIQLELLEILHDYSRFLLYFGLT